MDTSEQYKRVPFDIELAKKIQSGEVEGRIVTREGDSVRMLCCNAENEHPVVCLVKRLGSIYEDVHSYFETGNYIIGNSKYDLIIELPEETPKQKFKVGDIVKYGNSKEKFQLVKIDNSLPNNIWVEIIAFDGRCTIKCPMSEIKPYKETPKHEFKPFDKVLVRDEDHEAWNARLYDVWFPELGLHGTQDNKEWKQCVQYEGNEHLVGTINNPE